MALSSFYEDNLFMKKLTTFFVLFSLFGTFSLVENIKNQRVVEADASYSINHIEDSYTQSISSDKNINNHISRKSIQPESDTIYATLLGYPRLVINQINDDGSTQQIYNFDGYTFDVLDDSICEVDSSGYISPKTIGTTTIKITSNEGLVTSCSVVIFDTSLPFTKVNVSIGGTYSFSLKFESAPVPLDDDTWTIGVGSGSGNECASIEVNNGVFTLKGLYLGSDDVWLYYYDTGIYIYHNFVVIVSNDEASSWSTSFLDDISCDPTGVNPPSVDEWNAMKNSYNLLSSSAKEKIKTATAKENSSNVIEKAVYKYDYIILKYNKSSTVYEEFITNRVKSQIYISSLDSASNVNCLVILSIAAASTSLLTIAFILLDKRRKTIK